MRPSTSLIQHALLTSLTPLLFYALLSGFEHLLRDPLWIQEGLQNALQENHHSPKNDSQLATLFFSLIIQTKTAILQAYSSLFNFTLMAILLNILFVILRSAMLSKLDDLPKETLPSCRTLGRFKKFGKVIICYFAVYCCCSSALNSPFLSLNSPIQFNPSRLLETTSLPLSNLHDDSNSNSNNPTIPTQDIRTLSIGKTLSSLNINPDSILLSKDNKLAYVITRTYGALKIIDISDAQYPTVVGSLDLASFEFFALKKGIILSANGKTLFAANCWTFEIIDVSNPQAPRLIHSSKDSILSGPDILSANIPSFFVPTLAFSPDETTLYMAGLGLEIRNITDLSNPKVLFSKMSSLFDHRYRVTSLALLPDAKTLLVANGTLDLLDVSNPEKPRNLNIYPTDFSISSIALTKNAKLVYATGYETERQVMLEKIDISNPMSPQSLALYDLQTSTLFSPNIQALSPNETNIFIGVSLVDEKRMFHRYADLIGFDLVKEKILIQAKDLLSRTSAVAVTSEFLIAGSKDQFKIIQLYKNFPNTRNFCWYNNTNYTVQFPTEMKFAQPLLGYDGNIVLTGTYINKFAIYNVTDPKSPQKLSDFDFEHVDITFQEIYLSQNIAIFSSNYEILALDISNI